MTYRNKEVGYLPLVLRPGLAIVLATSLDIADGAVNDHTSKED